MELYISFMEEALEEAKKAFEEGEVPVGAVVAIDNRLISKAHNQVIALSDPTAHAEILALREAAKKIGNFRLEDAIVYVTKEPCCMCAGALVTARVKGLVYGISDPKAGACGSIENIAEHPRLNHQVEIKKGFLEDECKRLLQVFFKERRKAASCRV
jgi:tRNA(adenine34) deaminase